MGYQPSAQPPTWRTRGSLFVWSLPFDLFGMGVPARSLKTPADIALGVTGTHKPYHHCKVVIPSVRKPQNYKLITIAAYSLVISCLIGFFLLIAFQKYFWRSRFSEFDSNNPMSSSHVQAASLKLSCQFHYDVIFGILEFIGK